MMGREKEIEEMAKIIARRSAAFRNPNVAFMTTARKTADSIYSAGYRKQREVAREIFEEVDNIIYNLMNSPFYSSGDVVYELTELKKKYTGEKEDE